MSPTVFWIMFGVAAWGFLCLLAITLAHAASLSEKGGADGNPDE